MRFSSLLPVLCLLASWPLTAQSGDCLTQIRQGVTDAADWVDYAPNPRNPHARGIYVDVNTEDCGFKTTPHFTATLEYDGEAPGGGSHMWLITGQSAIYQASPEGFRVYLVWTHGPDDPERPNWLTAD